MTGHEAIFQALGKASMCWSETPKGVFDSEAAVKIGQELEELLGKPSLGEKVDGSTSDGFHTFNELYHYRALYHAAWVNEISDTAHELEIPVNEDWDLHKSWKHADGEPCFGGGWFVVMVNLPSGQVSNHYQARYWDLFHIDARDQASEWDGHTPAEAADRLEKYLAGEW